MPEPHVAILGGGPAGLGAAFKLSERNRAQVTLFEQQPVPGGNAGSFEFGEHRLDYGSHRLHPQCDPGILEDIRRFLGDDLLIRPRHGRIRLRERWIHFPLAALDLVLHAHPKFVTGAAKDALMGWSRRRASNGDASFAEVLHQQLGPTICRDFYFPYARKIWGLDPHELSPVQAQRRVKSSSPVKLVRKILGQLPGMRRGMTGRFFYPRHGFGQISEGYARAAVDGGAALEFGTRVVRLSPRESGKGWSIVVDRDGTERQLEADYVWSTLPITLLARLVGPQAPDEVQEAAASMSYRAMLLIYLEFAVDRFTEFDAHYFPQADINITRLSEPKNYAMRSEPHDRTVVCAELPCLPTDAVWRSTDEELADLVTRDLRAAGLTVPGSRLRTHVRRLPFAYPIYTIGYERSFDVIDAWATSLGGVLSFGRQGLFAHDNTHHALAMAYGAVDCLEGGRFDTARWARYREAFDTHVVED